MGRAWGRRKDSKLPILEDIVVGLDTPYLMAGKDLESGPGGAGFVCKSLEVSVDMCTEVLVLWL